MSYFVVPVAVALLLAPGRAGRIAVPPWRGALAGGGRGARHRPAVAVGQPADAPAAVAEAVESFHQTGSYPDRVLWFFTHGLPAELGFREIGTFDWVLGPIGFVAYLATPRPPSSWSSCGRCAGARGRWAPPFDGWASCSYPLIMATIPFVKSQGNLRYLFFLAPFLCLLLARLVGSRRVAMFVLAAAVVVDRPGPGPGAGRLRAGRGARTSWAVVDSLDELIRVLDAEGVHDVHADYWIAYRLAFETDERIIGSPSAGSLRYPPYDDRVRHADQAAWIVATDSSQQQALQQRLDELGVGYRVVPAGDLSVVLTDRNVQPEELPNEARTPEGWEMPPPPGESY